MEIGLRVPSRARSSARATSSCRRGCSSTSSARSRGQRVAGAAPPSRTSSCVGRGDLPHPHAALEDFPPLPGAGRDRVDVPAGAFVETVAEGGAGGLARRDAAGADGHPRVGQRRELRMVATDSYRLAVKETARGDLEGPFEANVPARALQELRGSPSRARGRLAVRVRANQVVFEVDGVPLSSRLIEGQFPNYSPAPARRIRPRAPPGRRRGHRGRAPHQPAGAEERAAARPSPTAR